MRLGDSFIDNGYSQTSVIPRLFLVKELMKQFLILGLMEDLEDMKKEAEDKKRKELMKKKMRR